MIHIAMNLLDDMAAFLKKHKRCGFHRPETSPFALQTLDPRIGDQCLTSALSLPQRRDE